MIPFHDQGLESRAIQTTLEFANLTAIPSVEVVHALFQGMTTEPFKVIPPEFVGAYTDDRDELVAWLDHLLRWKRLTAAGKRSVQEKIGTRLRGTVAGRVQWTWSDGYLRTYVLPVLDGVQACYSFAAALLADEGARRWQRLNRCRLNTCRRWFWEPVERPGPKRAYCSDQHATKDRKARFAKRHK